MKKTVSAFILGLLLVVSVNAAAMMGGSGGGMGGHMGQGMGGGLQGNSPPMRPDQGTYDSPRRPSRREGMSPAAAENLAREFMDRRTSEPYTLKNTKDGDTYYMTEVVRPNGDVIESLLIDKQTGQIHSLR